jgi:hypothetical protein
MPPEAVLARLMETRPQPLNALPQHQGIYALYDHQGKARYIGVTEMGLKKRIAQYHVGGDDNSHKFSTVYNAGRMFHSRNDIHTDNRDGRVAKRLRRLFARSRCHAVAVPLLGLHKIDLFALEAEVRRIAPAAALAWNDLRALNAYEPVEALDAFLNEIAWSTERLQAVERQAARWRQKQSEALLTTSRSEVTRRLA